MKNDKVNTEKKEKMLEKPKYKSIYTPDFILKMSFCFDSNYEVTFDINKVYFINMNDKKLTEIPDFSFFNETLREINLGKNKITKIENLDKLTKIINISLSENEIEEMKGLNECLNLKYLDLSKNKIHTIKGLRSFDNLTHLDLSENLIHKFEGLNHFKYFKTLDLSKNKFEVINEDLLDIGKITILTLTNNPIRISRVKPNSIKKIVDNYENLNKLIKLETLYNNYLNESGKSKDGFFKSLWH